MRLLVYLWEELWLQRPQRKQLVDYAGTFCSPISVRNPQLPGLLKSFMMYAQASYLKLNRPFDSIEMKLKAQKQLDELQIFSSEVASNLDKVTGSFLYCTRGTRYTCRSRVFS